MQTRLSALLLVGSLFLIKGSLGACAADAIPGDLGRLQGCWTAKAGPKRDVSITITVKGREVEVAILTSQGIKVAVQGGVKVDESVTPHSIDWVGLSLLDGQELPDQLAIYKVEGDTFTLRNAGPNARRPREFKAGEGLVDDLIVFTRQKGEAVAIK